MGLVLGFGAVAVDEIYYVDRPLSAGKGRVTGRITDHGGNVATALVQVARLGGQAGYVGWLGDGRSASETELVRQGVDIAGAPRRPDARSVRSIITVDPDGNRFIAYDDAVPHGTSDKLADAVLAAGRVLLIDAYATHSLDVVRRARALGVAVVADIEWSAGAETGALLAAADHVVLPMDFALAQTGGTTPAQMLDMLWSADRSAVVLTDGEHGCHLRQSGSDTVWHIPAHAVTAVDTTGAGDCFHGSYAWALAAGHAPLDAAVFANAAAALSVTRRGGQAGLPDRAAVDALLSSPDAPVACRVAQGGN
jgi:sugar/nucleoside kinase (ribokinase family)